MEGGGRYTQNGVVELLLDRETKPRLFLLPTVLNETFNCPLLLLFGLDVILKGFFVISNFSFGSLLFLLYEGFFCFFVFYLSQGGILVGTVAHV